jgi:ribonuclease E
MVRSMLIDASHPEETRVVVVNNDVLEAFDYESENRKQLKGNIYLAKVTRVEPSLQAAFIEYGGNRHGFLAFNEIHPDYYQIPVSDRERLIAESAELEKSEDDENGAAVETVGGDDSDEVARTRLGSYRNYKIQEVIKRRQILLVQVVKEERGNKGAAMTTYVSLAGRYCVLMPNTARGGGISRKIASITDRKRLKKILDGLEIPEGMAVIVRTAGAERTKAEISRDESYLLRLWNDIRSLTLKSTAPDLIHEEENLIKRSIRDLYSKEISEILVEGEGGYRLAKDFMRMLVPSHAKNVKSFKDTSAPLFYKYGIERQLAEIHDPVVRLISGGYLVINPTEALVAIDVNSGKATRERHIEATALKTNQEAAVEVARQLRLRDLAGLIVIDFIDMEVSRNIHAVERRLKDAMKDDRARIQVGRISPFGLLEMSRQRLRPSLTEASSKICVHCGGVGYVRTTEASALHALRAIEEEALRQNAGDFSLYVGTPVALYILNKKRDALAEIKTQHNLVVQILADEALIPPAFRIERQRGDVPSKVKSASGLETTEQSPEATESSGETSMPKRGPSRRSRGTRSEQTAEATPIEIAGGDGERSGGDAEIERADASAAPAAPEHEASEEEPRKKRRRGRRGGRRRSQRAQAEGDGAESIDAPTDAASGAPESQADENNAVSAEPNESATALTTAGEDEKKAPAPKRRRPARRKSRVTKSTDDREKTGAKPAAAKASGIKTPSDRGNGESAPDSDALPAGQNGEQAEVDSGAPIAASKMSPNVSVVADPSFSEGLPASGDDENKPARRGWWRRVIS